MKYAYNALSASLAFHVVEVLEERVGAQVRPLVRCQEPRQLAIRRSDLCYFSGIAIFHKSGFHWHEKRVIYIE